MASHIDREAIKAEVLEECISEARAMFPDLSDWVSPRRGPQPVITDHALLRYLERVRGIDVERARSEMNTAALRVALMIGSSGVRLSNGAKMVIKKGHVVTVLPPGSRVTATTFEEGK